MTLVQITGFFFTPIPPIMAVKCKPIGLKKAQPSDLFGAKNAMKRILLETHKIDIFD